MTKPMNHADPLAQLQDIVVPPPPGAWPPSSAWWFVGCFAILIMLAVVWGYRKTRKPLRKAALKLIDETFSHYATDHNEHNLMIQLSKDMRRIARQRYPDSQKLSGRTWLEFLNRTGTTNAFTTQSLEAMANAPYSNQQVSNIDTTFVRSTVEAWIRHNL